MSESGTRLQKAEVDVDKAEAILDKIEQVLHAVEKWEDAPKNTRALVRTATVVLVVSVAVAGVALIASRVRH